MRNRSATHLVWAAAFWCAALEGAAPNDGLLWRIENDALRVFVDARTSAISITDKSDGYTWRGVGVTTRAPSPLRNMNGLADAPGVQFDTIVRSRGKTIPLKMRLTLVGPELVVDIDMPDRGRMHPAFAAFPAFPLDSPRAALAVADYCNGHLYPLGLNPFPRRWFNANRLDMPWVALVDGPTGRGYALILDTSDDCAVRMRRVRAAGRETLAPVVEWWAAFRQFRYPRRMRYSFFSRGGYVAAAKRYRAFAKTQGLLVPFAEKVKKNPNIKRLFGAPDVWGRFSLSFARKAKALGVDKMLLHGKCAPEDMKQIHALGYLTSKYDNYTDILPLDDAHPRVDHNHGRLPDDAVLKGDGKRMTAWLTFDKKTQYMKRCPALWVPAAKLDIPKELVRYPYLGRFIDVTTAEGLYECFDPKHPLTRSQKRECGVALESYVRSLGLVVGGEHGIWWGVPHMDYLEGMMSANHYFSWPAGHLKHPKSKEQAWTNPWGRKLPTWDQYAKFGIGHEYRVPLWELVFHDCIVTTWYWGDSSDWLLDAAPEITPKKDAFNVLYGTIPLLWANRQGSWMRDRSLFLRTYRRTCKLHEQIAGEEMLSHEFLTADRAVQRTVFSSGTECVVNFGERPRQVTVKGESFLLPQNGWAVRGPKVRQSFALENGKPIVRIQTPGYYAFESPEGESSLRVIRPRVVRALIRRSQPGRLALELTRAASDWDFASTRVYRLNSAGEREQPIEHDVKGGRLLIDAPAGLTRLEALCGAASARGDAGIVAARAAAAERGRPTACEITLRNYGFAAAAGRIVAYADRVARGREVGAQDFALGPNETRKTTLRVRTDRLAGRHTILLLARARGQDLCAANNKACVRIYAKPDWRLWPARVPIVVDAGPVEREDAAVSLRLNLADVARRAGVKGLVDAASARVAETDPAGRPLRLVPAQFDPDEGTKGELCFLMPGRTPAGSKRTFALLLRAGKPALLPAAAQWWDEASQTVDAPGYVAGFAHGVLTSLAPKTNGRPGPNFLRNLILSSKATGWSEEHDGVLEELRVLCEGPVRCRVRVRRRLRAGVTYEKTYSFYPRRFDLTINVNKPAGGLYSRAHYELPGSYVDDKGVRAEIDGKGEENRRTYGRNRNPRWYAVTGRGWAHSCIARSRFDHVAYWDGPYMGAVGFVSRAHKNVRMSYVVHGEERDASFAKLDWRRLTQPPTARLVFPSSAAAQ